MTKKDKAQTDWTPEPFPEPRTVPEGWNPAAFENENKKPAAEETPADDWKPEPFPKPRSFPWNSGR